MFRVGARSNRELSGSAGLAAERQFAGPSELTASWLISETASKVHSRPGLIVVDCRLLKEMGWGDVANAVSSRILSEPREGRSRG
jgi:hypothetical protein